MPEENIEHPVFADSRERGLSSNGTEMYAKGVDRYLPGMRLRRIQE